MNNQKHVFPYIWNLSDLVNVEKNELNVFGTFVCGGGSTMGYKLAGYNHLGGVEIDKRISKVYLANHNPLFFYNQDIREFKQRNDLPNELYNLDILDGSPPCSSFSMSGNREKEWGKEKVFAEGQKLQTLDDLFFDYIDLAEKLQPKIVIAENVKGLIQGNARVYVKNIIKAFDKANYDVQLFLINAKTLGVPQNRERVFFVCKRKDLGFPKLRLNFNETEIPFSEISDNQDTKINLTDLELKYWHKAKEGKSVGKFKTNQKYYWNKPAKTIVSSSYYYHCHIPREINNGEYIKAGSFPQDYNFLGVKPKYIIGMSVPPIMTAQIARQIKLQWFDLFNK